MPVQAAYIIFKNILFLFEFPSFSKIKMKEMKEMKNKNEGNEGNEVSFIFWKKMKEMKENADLCFMVSRHAWLPYVTTPPPDDIVTVD